MAWTTPTVPTTGQLITAGFWQAQIPDNLTVLKTSIDDNGHLAFAPNLVSANYTLTATDDVVLVDATSGAITITVPVSSGTRKRYEVKKIDSSANPVHFASAGVDVLDFAAFSNFSLEVSMQSVTLQAYPTSNLWLIL